MCNIIVDAHLSMNIQLSKMINWDNFTPSTGIGRTLLVSALYPSRVHQLGIKCTWKEPNHLFIIQFNIM